MRYLVKARLKPCREKALLKAIADGTLGEGSIAAEEWPYWQKYFDLLKITDAHNRKNGRHENGTEPWACCDCDCTKRLEERLQQKGKPFLKALRPDVGG